MKVIEPCRYQISLLDIPQMCTVCWSPELNENTVLFLLFCTVQLWTSLKIAIRPPKSQYGAKKKKSATRIGAVVPTKTVVHLIRYRLLVSFSESTVGMYVPFVKKGCYNLWNTWCKNLELFGMGHKEVSKCHKEGVIFKVWLVILQSKGVL